ncbi:hypothetical protein O3G_MSEX000234 [Manduca sexta]|nr:hypothetical protein O3G_MSEX000234 [Manduca sexta]
MFSQEENKLISIEINKLLKLGAIVECSHSDGQFLSSIFLHPKSDGTWRFILNLKKLNNFIATRHFKLEDIRTATKLMTSGCFMATIDLKNAYYLLSITNSDRKYLRFLFQGTLYEFTCLPFGLSTAPYVFTKIMKPVVFHLRSLGLLSVIYLDDFLCIADTYEKCLQNVSTTKQILESLGFIINIDKSHLEPSQVCQYLGFVLDSRFFSVSLPARKIEYISKLVNNIRKKQRCKIIEFAQLLGTLVASCPAVEYGWLYTKTLENHKTTALKNNYENYNAFLPINKEVQIDLQWWASHIKSNSNSIKQFNFCLEIFSDASRTGWGLVCNNIKNHGHWTEHDKMFHINYLELLAAFIGLKTYALNLRHCEVLLRIDNTTAIAYVNKMGGTRFPHLHSLARKLWQWCEERHIWVYASYISSKDNTIADLESRRPKSEIEWELCDKAYEMIVVKFGKPHIDLFANKFNAKCIKYVSWLPDLDAFTVDAFTINWHGMLFYAFPPFALISRVLQKIKREKAIGIVLVPWWPTQPWYPFFKSMVVSEELILEPSSDLLLSPSRCPHPLHKNLRLVAAKLSGARF